MSKAASAALVVCSRFLDVESSRNWDLINMLDELYKDNNLIAALEDESHKLHTYALDILLTTSFDDKKTVLHVMVKQGVFALLNKFLERLLNIPECLRVLHNKTHSPTIIAILQYSASKIEKKLLFQLCQKMKKDEFLPLELEDAFAVSHYFVVHRSIQGDLEEIYEQLVQNSGLWQMLHKMRIEEILKQKSKKGENILHLAFKHRNPWMITSILQKLDSMILFEPLAVHSLEEKIPSPFALLRRNAMLVDEVLFNSLLRKMPNSMFVELVKDELNFDAAFYREYASEESEISSCATIPTPAELIAKWVSFTPEFYSYYFSTFSGVEDRCVQKMSYEEFDRLLMAYLSRFDVDSSYPTCHGSAMKEIFDASTKLYIHADYHGSLTDLLETLKMLQSPEINMLDEELKFKNKDYRLVLLGDYVHRGGDGFKILALLMALKLQNPDNVIILRGNHENVFYHLSQYWRVPSDELQDYLGHDSMGKRMASIERFFNSMPIVYLFAQNAKKKVFTVCCHGIVNFSFNPQSFLKGLAKMIPIERDYNSILDPSFQVKNRALRKITEKVKTMYAHVMDQFYESIRQSTGAFCANMDSFFMWGDVDFTDYDNRLLA